MFDFVGAFVFNRTAQAKGLYDMRMTPAQTVVFVISSVLMAGGLAWVVHREISLQPDHRTTSSLRLALEVAVPLVGAVVLMVFVGGVL